MHTKSKAVSNFDEDTQLADEMYEVHIHNHTHS